MERVVDNLNSINERVINNNYIEKYDSLLLTNIETNQTFNLTNFSHNRRAHPIVYLANKCFYTEHNFVINFDLSKMHELIICKIELFIFKSNT